MATGQPESDAVVGFDPGAGRWATATDRASLDAVPRLDGALRLDPATRAAAARDEGNIVWRQPGAVLEPGSARDIQLMIRFCRRHRIPVATRGQGHSTYGQALVTGLLVDSRSLNRIHAIGPEGAEVDGGVLWKDLVLAAYQLRLTPPVLTGYLGLSVGGTLSMGGIAECNVAGSQIDRVRELEVVTGAGDLVRCSMTQHRELFEVVLGGVGQCAVITRATVDLVPARSMVRTYTLDYADTGTFFGDLRILLGRGETGGVFNLSASTADGPAYGLTANVSFEPSQPPDDEHLLRGLSRPPSAAAVADSGYLGWALRTDVLLGFLRATMAWNDLVKPWFTVWLPGSAVEGYVGEVIPTLRPDDVGPNGLVLLYPQRRATLTQPFLRLPAGDDEWVYLFAILTASSAPGPDPAFTVAMLNRNRRLFEAARSVGGTHYPVGSVEFSPEDWTTHYGELWSEFQRRKRRFDPDGLLTPGPGIFPGRVHD